MTTVLPAPPAPAPLRPRIRRPAHEPDPVPLGPHLPPHGLPGARPVVPGTPSFPGDPPGPPARERARRPSAEDVELQRLAGETVRRMVEVLAGRRAPAHLAGVAQPQVVRYLTATRDSGRAGREATPPRRVHVARPSPDVAELTAVCPFGRRRVRALAVRLERSRDGRRAVWRASAARLL